MNPAATEGQQHIDKARLIDAHANLEPVRKKVAASARARNDHQGRSVTLDALAHVREVALFESDDITVAEQVSQVEAVGFGHRCSTGRVAEPVSVGAADGAG